MHGLGQGCPPFFEVKMAASSVTGVGLGDSNGKQKHENHSGCGCCFGSKTDPAINTKRKTGCVVRYNSGRAIYHKIKSSSIISNKSCF
jgi:hypothetical protein